MNTGKKILILGGKPIGSVEIVNRLKDLGYYVIVTDYLTSKDSKAKQIADEAWNISTSDIDILSEKIKETKVSGILTGVHEFNINRMLDLCELLNLPCYCNRETWKYCDNKSEFKSLCINNNIPTAQTYSIESIRKSEDAIFPVIVKPVDGSGSRGFHICNNLSELEKYYVTAAQYSPTSTVLIEEYIPFNSVIIHYTMTGGKCIYSGMSDKISVKFKNTGASVMGIQTFPSNGESKYLDTLNEKTIKMFEKAGFTDGPIWIEAFYDGNDRFIFNEMGYRFGGSLTYYPVRYFHDINQLDLMISHATGDKIDNTSNVTRDKKKYCILPIHIKKGTIRKVDQTQQLLQNKNIHAIVPVHFEKEEIQDWGSAQQVFAYVHILYSDIQELKHTVSFLLKNLTVLDQNGENMIHTLFDINSLS